MESEEISDERLEAEDRILADPVAYTLFNPFQCRIIDALADPDLAVLVIHAGNGSGKTFGVRALESAIIFGTMNPLFNVPLVNAWPHPKSMRICSTLNAVEDRGPIQTSMRELYPDGRYQQARGTGKGYFSRGETDTGWDWDIKTYNQSPQEMAGNTKGLMVYVEPPDKAIFNENVGRTRKGALTIIEMTPLTYAGWVKDDLIDPGWLTFDGKKVGKVIAVGADVWENCSELHEGGQLSRKSIQIMISQWPEEEREAREKGTFMHLAGRIYRKWGDQNEITELADYHQECWDKGKVNLGLVMDPHDRKPWALAWKAVFPNDDRITIAEWPPFRFDTCTNSPVSDIEDYRDIILETETELGMAPHFRLTDPNFGNAPKAGTGRSVKQLLAQACRRCLKPGGLGEAACTHKLIFSDAPDAIDEGHLLVRRSVGDLAKGVRPKTYALKACINTCFSMRRYAYKENKDPSKGVSERPEFVYKDFADLERYHELSPYAKYQGPAEPSLTFWKPKMKGRSVRLT